MISRYTHCVSQIDIKANGITQGVIWKQLLSFFFPILLGTFFQQLYNTVDAIVVGQYLGKAALAAVGGGTGTAINLLIGFFTGLSSGATVIISQYYGAKDEEMVSKSIHTAIMLAFVGGIAITVLGYAFSEPILIAIGTPEDILPMAVTYMHIYFLGSVAIVMYNMGAGIFRAFGDSRRPFYFLLVGCLVNIVLDIVLVGFTSLGVAGAAIATVFSQVVSVVLVFWVLMRKTDCTKLYLKKIRFTKSILRNMLLIGFPAGIQSIMYTISNLIIQSSINAFGTDTAAAWAAYSKIDQIFWMFINAFGIALTTFVGQNYGAGRPDRAKKGVVTCTAISAVGTFVIEALFLLIGTDILRLFTSDDSVLQVGHAIIVCIVPWYISYIAIELLSGAIRGTGKSFVPTIICIFGICVLRTVWIYIVPYITPTLEGVLWSYPLTWVITSILFVIYYLKGHIYDRRYR